MTYEPPDHLDEQAREKWKQIVAAIIEVATWTPAIADAAAVYSVTWSRWAAAEKQVAELGPVIKSPSGFPCQNPYLSIANRALVDLRHWAKVLNILEGSQ